MSIILPEKGRCVITVTTRCEETLQLQAFGVTFWGFWWRRKYRRASEMKEKTAKFISHKLSLDGGQMCCSQPQKYIMEINISTSRRSHNPASTEELPDANK